jgi:hypothetical protein
VNDGAMNNGLVVAYLVVLGQTAIALVLGWHYFRRYRISRPPIGVMGPADVAVVLGGVVLVPYVYLALPPRVAAGVLGLTVLGLLHLTWEPMLPAGRAPWLAAGAMLAAALGAWLRFGPTSAPFFAANNLVLIVAVVGAANLWAQSGLKSRHAAVLAGALAIYDHVFTSRLTLTADLYDHLADLPFVPLIGWPIGDGLWLGIGLGDLLLAVLFPLVARRAFGRPAGLSALALTLGALAAMLALPVLGIADGFPAMVVLGPLIVVQHLSWTRRHGTERTTWQYRQAECSEPAWSPLATVGGGRARRPRR